MNVVFSHRLEVRFRDCDPMGHANNAVYLTYLEQARLAHWRAVGSLGVSDARGEPGVILARAEIDYRAPARYGEELEVRLGIAAVGRTSFTYDYEIVGEGERVVALAKTVLVMYDYAAGKPVPVSDEIRRKLTRS
jgi:acyl-CoA thioester hydrolase